jgi:signal transduction histidine kinase
VPDGSERDLVLPALVGAAVAAVIFRPLRRRGPAATRRPDEIVRAFGERAGAGVDEREVLLELAEAVRRALAARSVEVWTGVPTLLERAAATPDRPPATVELHGPGIDVLCRSGVVGRAWLELWLPELATEGSAQVRLAPACHSGVLLGYVVATRVADDPPFAAADDAVLATVGDRLGVALHNRRLDDALQATLDDLRRTNDELRASRARLVAASDAERRRIERDIHDGAQQHLVALAVNVRLARDLIADDPAGAAAALDAIGVGLRDAIQELRELAQGVYPPLLADSGLADALRSATARAANDVTLRADGIGRYRADVEAAVYFACLEALQNAAKHAPGATVRMTLSGDGGAVRAEIVDDGPGFDQRTVVRGAGLASIADRIGAVGGTAAWDTAPGRGTRLVLDVPDAG